MTTIKHQHINKITAYINDISLCVLEESSDRIWSKVEEPITWKESLRYVVCKADKLSLVLSHLNQGTKLEWWDGDEWKPCIIEPRIFSNTSWYLNDSIEVRFKLIEVEKYIAYNQETGEISTLRVKKDDILCYPWVLKKITLDIMGG